MEGVERMRHIPLSSITVKLIDKIRLFRKISGTSSENEPTMLVQNYKREASKDRRRRK
jgi:hypothetical protein